jgi:hypothetical protein
MYLSLLPRSLAKEQREESDSNQKEKWINKGENNANE